MQSNLTWLKNLLLMLSRNIPKFLLQKRVKNSMKNEKQAQIYVTLYSCGSLKLQRSREIALF